MAMLEYPDVVSEGLRDLVARSVRVVDRAAS